jgi:phosphoglycerol transferase MdoB-like AlkP superfamily enzyme
MAYHGLLVVVAVVLLLIVHTLASDAQRKAIERSRAYRFYTTLLKWSLWEKRNEPVAVAIGIAWMVIVALVFIEELASKW